MTTARNVIDTAPEWVRVHNSRNISLEHNWANAHKLSASSAEKVCHLATRIAVAIHRLRDLFAKAGIFNSVDIRQLGNVNVSGHAFPADARLVIDAAGLLKG